MLALKALQIELDAFCNDQAMLEWGIKQKMEGSQYPTSNFMICAFFASPNINKVEQCLTTTEPSSKRSQLVLVLQFSIPLKGSTQSAYVCKCLDNDIYPVMLGYNFSRILLQLSFQRIGRIFTTLDIP